MSWTRIAVPAAVTTGVLAILLVWHGQEPMRTASLGETQKAAVSAPKPLPATPPPAPSPAPPEDRAGRTGGERGACEVSLPPRAELAPRPPAPAADNFRSMRAADSAPVEVTNAPAVAGRHRAREHSPGRLGSPALCSTMRKHWAAGRR